MLSPEESSVPMMEVIDRMFGNPHDLVLDAFAGMCPTAKACLYLDKHRRFNVFENDSSW